MNNNIYLINPALPMSTKIALLNSMILALDNTSGQFNKIEIGWSNDPERPQNDY